MDLKAVFLQEVVPQLFVLAGIALAALGVYGRSKLKKLLESKVENQAVQGALLWVNSLVFDMVQAAAQTTVKELKNALADGKITKEEYRAGLARIKKELSRQLLRQTVGKLLGAGVVEHTVEAARLIDAKIEAAVPLAKASQVAAKKGPNQDPL